MNLLSCSYCIIFFFSVVYKKKKYTKKTYGHLKLENGKKKLGEGKMGNSPY